ncbi:cytochrome c oxidase subunit II [Actinosynnema pretiosum subsp. pretiosum]|uniref:cytochrome-c oxidase n=2 Tax=Actinosynnema TaxID=40566 RepID=C6W9F6_ACTMD|nr:cytochrome c oxidase subunit II [Actinosynnema mirum]ACU35319.1 cytochrome c oxidase, subunit II [Actinosynnema mirum DSM 43827]AXX28690.1 Cytochrome c oxidase polypeptide II [Actinosynnema pretiosum subsp. pretiosum]QUF06986.1 cytochrome c oxidase subunit II [Actinosynnema pretiosum subsp. pretiosum]
MGLKEGTRAARLAKVTGLVGLVGIGATGCSTDEVLRFGWPVSVTPQAEAMRELWTWSVVAALVVGVIVWGLILWAVAFHRKKSEELPRQVAYNLPLELVLIVVPTVIVAVLFYFTAVTQNYVTDKSQDPDVTVDVIGFQWNWEFQHRDAKVEGTDQPVSTVGTSTEIPMLVLPAEKRVRFVLRSTDVIHSFFVPEFHFKRDVFPEPEKNNQDNVFQIDQIDRPGSFVGRCAELCGTYHAVMNFEVRALPAADYDRYIELRTQVNEATGKPYTNAEALTEMNCGELCTPYAVTTQPFDTDRTAREASGAGSK